MAENATLVALTQMVDISCNCKEGVINFQVLHVLLNVIIQQLSLNDVAVEFRGPESDRIQALISSANATDNLYPEYSITGPKGKRKSSFTKKQISLQDVVKDQEKKEETKEKERATDGRKNTKDDQGNEVGVSPTDVNTVVLIDAKSTLPQFTVAASKSTLDDIQSEIRTIREDIKELKELPGNFGLIEATRDVQAPILDMFQILNITKRMDATEIALQKMGSLVEDVAKHDLTGAIAEKIQDVKIAVEGAGTNGENRRGSAVFGLEIRVTTLEESMKKIMEGEIAVPAQRGESQIEDEYPKGGDDGPTKSDPKIVREKSEASRKVPPPKEISRSSVTPGRKSTSKMEIIKMLSPKEPFISVIQNADLAGLSTEDALTTIQEDFIKLSKWIADNLKEIEKSNTFGGGEGGEVNVESVENKFNEYTQQLAEMNEIYNNQIDLLNQRFESVQADMSDVVTKLEVVLPGGDSTGVGLETRMDLDKKLELLEKEILIISAQAAKLEEDKIKRDEETQVILEQLDVLKIIKANREDLEDALEEKADTCMINRKVSHDQFDAACDDLSKGIEEALNKLEEQQELWQQALDSIQKEVGNKLDKNEVNPLRDFVNSKLRALQEKFKALAALKRGQEAAGTKTKILKDVNCISCDKDVVMRRELDVSFKPKAYAMPPSRSIAPYLTYELDQLRKQQKCVPGNKNLNFLESALKTRGQKDRDHLCSRYCGGSHTVTTPQQRVTRLGHFLEQWGPEIAPLQDEFIKGYDNHMYKARDDSLYKKPSKRDPKGMLATKDVATPTKAPQEPQIAINSDATEAVVKDAQTKRGIKKKVSNIGSTGIDSLEVKTLQASGAQKGSQMPEHVKQSQVSKPSKGSREMIEVRSSENVEKQRSSTTAERAKPPPGLETSSASQVAERGKPSQSSEALGTAQASEGDKP